MFIPNVSVVNEKLHRNWDHFYKNDKSTSLLSNIAAKDAVMNSYYELLPQSSVTHPHTHRHTHIHTHIHTPTEPMLRLPVSHHITPEPHTQTNTHVRSVKDETHLLIAQTAWLL